MRRVLKVSNKIRFKDVLFYADDLCRRMTFDNVSCCLDRTVPCGYAKTIILDDSRVYIVTGISDIFGINDRLSGVDQDKVYRFSLATHHEFRHVCQSGICNVGNVSVEESLFHAGSLNNEDWYMDNYKNNAMEICAEMYGISESIKDLKCLFSGHDWDKCLADHVNHKIDSGVMYFLPEKPDKQPYKDISEIMSAFDVALEKSVSEPHFYGKRYYMRRTDEVNVGMHLWDRQSPWWEYYDQMMFPGYKKLTGLDQDKMFACYTFHVHPEYKERYPALKDMDLSPESVFGRPFPESGGVVRDRIARVMEEGIENQRPTFSPDALPVKHKGFTPADYVTMACDNMESDIVPDHTYSF